MGSRTRALTLYPAIDLKNGQCVRLRQGAMATATVFGDDPGAQAAAFVAGGARFLHVVDLDGAFAGRQVNRDAVASILAAAGATPVQLGGGLRDLAAIEAALRSGVRRVVLGSAAVREPALVREAALAFPGQVAAGIDARDGRVATDGWAAQTDVDAASLAIRMEEHGAAAIVLTAIGRDGTGDGLDLALTGAVASRVGIPVIASGGVGTLAHLQALVAAAEDAPGIEGVIVGRAFYENTVPLRAALDLLAEAAAGPC